MPKNFSAFLALILIIFLFSSLVMAKGDDVYQLRNITSGQNSQSVTFTGPEPEGWFWEYYPDSGNSSCGDLYAIGFFVVNRERHTCGSLSVRASKGDTVKLYKNGNAILAYTVSRDA